MLMTRDLNYSDSMLVHVQLTLVHVVVYDQYTVLEPLTSSTQAEHSSYRNGIRSRFMITSCSSH